MSLDDEYNIMIDRRAVKQFITDHVNMPSSSTLLFQGSTVTDTLFQFAFESWVGSVADKVIADIDALSTDGTVPAFAIGNALNVGFSQLA